MLVCQQNEICSIGITLYNSTAFAQNFLFFLDDTVVLPYDVVMKHTYNQLKELSFKVYILLYIYILLLLSKETSIHMWKIWFVRPIEQRINS